MNKEEIQAIERCENFSINVLVEHPDIYGSRWLVQEDIKSIKAVKTLLRLYRQLEQENKELHNKIDKVVKFIEDSYYSKNTVDIDSVSITNNKLIQIRKILKGDVDGR